jgi:hypothetical protein
VNNETIESTRAFLGLWVAEFNSRDPARMVALYADDAALHGTSRAKLYLGREQIRTYFRGTSTVELGEQVLDQSRRTGCSAWEPTGSPERRTCERSSPQPGSHSSCAAARAIGRCCTTTPLRTQPD